MAKAPNPQSDAEDRLDIEPDVHALAEGSPIEQNKDEVEDSIYSPSHYEIVSIPADYTLEGLIGKWKKKQLTVPGFQRKFVWTQRQASRLIESFILGLPVPALFLYTDPDSGEQQVIDGQQRLTSVVKFFEGRFINANMTTEKVFRLVGLSDDSPYKNCTIADIEEKFPAKFAKLNDAVMRAFVIKQLDPDDATSIYHIFERLNTGGSQLLGQEIRNCVYHGRLNDLLNALNEDTNWRKIIGKPIRDGRMRDVEMILRFVALYYFSGEYKKPMKDFLSWAMKKKRQLPTEEAEVLAETFRDSCARIVETLGPQPFHGHSGMNPAIFDAIFTAVAEHPGQLAAGFKSRFESLVKSWDFKTNSSYRTTDAEPVANRLNLARTRLFDSK